MINIIMIKTPNCPNCKVIEPQWKDLKERINEQYSDKVAFFEYIVSIDNIAIKYVNLLNIKQAPSFVIEFDDDISLIKFENIESTLLMSL